MARISSETIEAVNSAGILDLAYALGNNPKRIGKQYQIPCPNPGHLARVSDNTYIEPNKNLFKCFACEASGSSAFNYYFWNEFGRAYDKNNKEDKKTFPKVIEAIAGLLGIPIVYDDGSTVQTKRKPYVRPQTKELEPLSDDICDKVYRAFLSLCPIRKEHAIEWMEKRKYTKEDIIALGFRSIPSGEELMPILHKLILKEYPLARVPGFVQRLIPESVGSQYPKELVEPDKEGRGFWVWTISAGKGGYFIPVRDRQGRIVRMRIRRDAGNPKYIWFSSTDNTATEKEKYQIRRNGAASGAPLHIAPPVSQVKIWEVGNDLSEVYNVKVIIGTEGEHKAQLAANILKSTIVGIPGVGNFAPLLPLLKDWGTKKFILAYDMDTLKREDDSIKAQKKQQLLFDKVAQLATEVKNLGIDCYLWTWDIKDGKGLDDLLQNGKLPMEIDFKTKARKLVNLKELHLVS